jgi:hypothetical protein
MSTLKGIILYGAVLTFAGLYGYFIVRISVATRSAPALDATLVSTAAALAGVLGSAFALEIGTATDPTSANSALSAALSGAVSPRQKAMAMVWRLLSVDAKDPGSASWPKTFGIWVYAVVGSAVAITYVLNQNQTPQTIKALAVAFGGYVLALVTAAYRSAS